MPWQIYAIAITIIIWILDISIRSGVKRIDMLTEFNKNTKIPILIEKGYIYGNMIKFAYTNCVEKKIVGFEITIVIFDKITNTFDYPTHFIECKNGGLKSYNSRNIKIEATLIDLKNQEIKEIYIDKVLFDDNSVWKK